MKSTAIGSLVVARISSRTMPRISCAGLFSRSRCAEHCEQVHLLDVLFARQRGDGVGGRGRARGESARSSRRAGASPPRRVVSLAHRAHFSPRFEMLAPETQSPGRSPRDPAQHADVPQLRHDVQLRRHARRRRAPPACARAQQRHELVVLAVKEEKRRIVRRDERRRRRQPVLLGHFAGEPPSQKARPSTSAGIGRKSHGAPPAATACSRVLGQRSPDRRRLPARRRARSCPAATRGARRPSSRSRRCARGRSSTSPLRCASSGRPLCSLRSARGTCAAAPADS